MMRLTQSYYTRALPADSALWGRLRRKSCAIICMGWKSMGVACRSLHLASTLTSHATSTGDCVGAN
jgi:hypothetical protein